MVFDVDGWYRTTGVDSLHYGDLFSCISCNSSKAFHRSLTKRGQYVIGGATAQSGLSRNLKQDSIEKILIASTQDIPDVRIWRLELAESSIVTTQADQVRRGMSR